jgi:hypothetical protein
MALAKCFFSCAPQTIKVSYASPLEETCFPCAALLPQVLSLDKEKVDYSQEKNLLPPLIFT